MRDLLIQFIVPLTFLAIWALTSILNRDGQPLPQRPQRPGGPRPDPAEEARRRRERARAAAERSWEGAGERPSPAGPPRPEPRRPSPPPIPNAADGGRPRPQRPARPAPSQTVPAGFDGAGVFVKPDEVVFLDPATGRRLMSSPIDGERPADASKPPSPPRRRKPDRQRASTEKAKRPPESETRRALSDHVGRLMTDLRQSQSLELQPLASKLEGLTTNLSQSVSLMDQQPLDEESIDSPIFDAHAIQDLLAERDKLREITVLSEVLRPPVSIRRMRER